MKSKGLLKIGFLCILCFIAVASYLWYQFFHENKSFNIDNNVAVEFLNNGGINYINAAVDDTDDVIPVYYFRVKNHLDKEDNYEVIFKQVMPSEVNDGCDEETTFALDELIYELKLDGQMIKTGLLSEINNRVIDSRTITGQKTVDYAFRVRLKDDTVNYDNKHFHYVIEVKEKK